MSRAERGHCASPLFICALNTQHILREFFVKPARGAHSKRAWTTTDPGHCTQNLVRYSTKEGNTRTRNFLIQPHLPKYKGNIMANLESRQHQYHRYHHNRGMSVAGGTEMQQRGEPGVSPTSIPSILSQQETISTVQASEMEAKSQQSGLTTDTSGDTDHGDYLDLDGSNWPLISTRRRSGLP
jgi:hypothetical protein